VRPVVHAHDLCSTMYPWSAVGWSSRSCTAWSDIRATSVHVQFELTVVVDGETFERSGSTLHELAALSTAVGGAGTAS